MNNRKKINYIFYLAIFIGFLISFHSNFFNIASSEHFEKFAWKTGNFVFGRVAMSEQQGVFSYGGLLGREVNLNGKKEKLSTQREIYYSDIPIKKFRTYNSQCGFSGIAFSIFDKVSPFDDVKNAQIWKVLLAALSSLILLLFLIWINNYIGFIEAIITSLFLFLSPWLVVSSAHFFWMFGLFLLPLVSVLWILSKDDFKSFILFLVVFLTVLVKCCFTGYELISSACFVVLPPVLWIAIWKKWSVLKSISTMVQVGIATITAMLVSMVILCFQIAEVEGSFSKGVEHIKQRFLLRTHGANSVTVNKNKLKESYSVPLVDVLKIYLEKNALSVNFKSDGTDKVLSLSFLYVFIIATILSVLAWLLVNSLKIKSLIIASVFSFIGPLSWYVIFKSHSVMHPFLDALAWYLPTMLIIFVLIAHATRSLVEAIVNRFVTLKK